MGSLTDQLDKKREEKPKGGNIFKKKIPTGEGDGKWETQKTIVKYRKSRDSKKKHARAARKKNRR